MNRVVAGRVGLVAASALHLGFQATVTAVVYPELFSGPRSSLPERQGPHVERVAPMGLGVYAALLGAAGVATVTGHRSPAGRARTAAMLSCAAAALSPVLSAGVSAPLHVGLARGHGTPALLEGILATDRTRSVLAALGLVAAVRSLT